jgi:hypothetical protein
MIRGNSHSFAKMFALVPVASIVLVAIAAMPAQAASGGFNSTGSRNVARMGHIATLLQNGEVLVTGGLNYTDSYLASGTGLYVFGGDHPQRTCIDVNSAGAYAPPIPLPLWPAIVR